MWYTRHSSLSVLCWSYPGRDRIKKNSNRFVIADAQLPDHSCTGQKRLENVLLRCRPTEWVHVCNPTPPPLRRMCLLRRARVPRDLTSCQSCCRFQCLRLERSGTQRSLHLVPRRQPVMSRFTQERGHRPSSVRRRWEGGGVAGRRVGCRGDGFPAVPSIMAATVLATLCNDGPSGAERFLREMR